MVYDVVFLFPQSHFASYFSRKLICVKA
uniref:Uncharacterized protein n=1 Tax=Anguilla anguilla TaxID=7936 RepID=A0A0E9QY27_ANGAN